MSRRHLLIPAIALDRASDTPLHRQLREQLEAAIVRHGRGADHACLPSTRTLALSLGVSRNTVLAAYDELVADGYLEGRRGEGMIVVAGDRRRSAAFDVSALLRAAQYPVRTVALRDPDGMPLYVAY